MDVAAICDICGSAGVRVSCKLCGARVCRRCLRGAACVRCAGGRSISGL